MSCEKKTSATDEIWEIFNRLIVREGNTSTARPEYIRPLINAVNELICTMEKAQKIEYWSYEPMSDIFGTLTHVDEAHKLVTAEMRKEFDALLARIKIQQKRAALAWEVVRKLPLEQRPAWGKF